MTGSILLGIFIIILVLAAVLVVRTCSRQPTPAMTASVELDKGPRAREYGEQLSKMIQKETVSSRFDSDKTKYYEFHKILEELFPLVHKTIRTWWRRMAAGSMNPLAAILTGKENSGGAAPWTPRAACTVFSVRWRS